MEYSPTKRRKTSPTTGIAVSASNPSNGLSRQDVSRSTGQRRSYMSPTKASISRFNPNLLPRSGSVDARRPTSSGAQASPRRSQTAELTSMDVNGVPYDHVGPSTTHSRQARTNGKGVEEREGSSDITDTPSKLPRSIGARGSRDIVPRKNVAGMPTYRGQEVRMEDAAQIDEPEPSLPSTPSQLGLEPPPEKPKGLLFQSPSKRPSPNTRLITLSSPLKPREQAPQPATTPFNRIASTLGPRIYIESAPKTLPPNRFVNDSGFKLSLQQLDARLIALQDELTLKSMQSRWRKEEPKWGKILIKKRRDVARCGRDVLDIRKNNEKQLYPDRAQTRSRDDDVDQSLAIKSISSRLARFCPFSMRHPSSATESVARPQAPNLPFTIRIPTSVIAPGRLGGLAVRQQVELATPDSATVVSLQLSIDPMTQQVSPLEVLNTATWATTELNPWLSQSSIERTPTMIGTAIGRYIEVSGTRAHCWSQCNAHLRNLIVKGRDLNSKAAALGLRSIHFARALLKMTIEWNIGVNDEGEIESTVLSKCSFPENYRQFDSREDLSRIDEVFDNLIREKYVAEAIRIMAKILFPP